MKKEVELDFSVEVVEAEFPAMDNSNVRTGCWNAPCDNDDCG